MTEPRVSGVCSTNTVFPLCRFCWIVVIAPVFVHNTYYGSYFDAIVLRWRLTRAVFYKPSVTAGFGNQDCSRSLLCQEIDFYKYKECHRLWLWSSGLTQNRFTFPSVWIAGEDGWVRGLHMSKAEVTVAWRGGAFWSTLRWPTPSPPSHHLQLESLLPDTRSGLAVGCLDTAGGQTAGSDKDQ